LAKVARHLSKIRGKMTYPPNRTRGLRGGWRVKSGALNLGIGGECLEQGAGQGCGGLFYSRAQAIFIPLSVIKDNIRKIFMIIYIRFEQLEFFGVKQSGER